MQVLIITAHFTRCILLDLMRVLRKLYICNARRFIIVIPTACFGNLYEAFQARCCSLNVNLNLN